MENYEQRQKERESEFKKELTALLRKYNANIEVRDTPSGYYGYDIDVDVELEGDYVNGEVIEPYTHFQLPKYIDKDTEL